MEANNTCLSFSAGELIINSAESNDFVLTQGFQQPELSKEIATALTVANGLILDGNDANGIFKVEELSEFPDNELIILNRLGEVLFRAKPYQNDWNGYYNGQPLPQATYYYILYLDEAKTNISKGNIYILKS